MDARSFSSPPGLARLNIRQRLRNVGSAIAALAIGVSLVLVPSNATPAAAESSLAGTTIRSGNTFYAFVDAGETLDARFTQSGVSAGGVASTITVSRPGAAPTSCVIPAAAPTGYACAWNGLEAPTAGIWEIAFRNADDVHNGRYVDWDIDVRSGGVEVPGRVWVDKYTVAQLVYDGVDLPLYYQAKTGDQYRAVYRDFNGVDAVFVADATGIRADGSCEPYYQSALPLPWGGGLGTPHSISGGECGPLYKIFFAAPAEDLPASAPMHDGGTEWILPDIVDPEITGLTFTPESGSIQSGTISFAVSNYFAPLSIQIDADGNGAYDDDVDRELTHTVTDGNEAVTFDGIDGLGAPIPADREITIRAQIDRTGEIHFVNDDVEKRGGGIEVTAMRGASAGDATLYWDDTHINTQQDQRCSALVGPVSALDGVDSTGGAHGWPLCANPGSSNANDGIRGSYGDRRMVQEWTYRSVDVARSVTVDARSGDVTVEKSADPASGTAVHAGDVIDYTLTFRNVGTADGLVDHDDVIDGVLDDATMTSAPVSSDPALEVSAVVGGRFTVDGVLAAGQTVTVSYSVTVNADDERGDHVLANFVVPGGEDAPATCASDSTLCTEHPVPMLMISKTSDADNTTRGGDTVTYTVTATNMGGFAYTDENPASVTDDLSGLLDDASYNDDAAANRAGEVTYSEPKLSWSGALGVGEAVSLSYTITVGAGGDGVVRNVAFIGEPADPTPVCDGDTDAADRTCAATEFELPRLRVSKSADVTELPAEGGTVTYAVTVTNDGPGAYTEDAPAHLTDDLRGVLDDAEFGEILEPATGAAFDADARELTWSGALAANASTTVRYTVVVGADRGDNALTNVACVPELETAPGASACSEVRIPLAELDVRKSVTPDDGTAVDPGQRVTYTLSFASVGTADASVDMVDDLAGVLDDAELVSDSVDVSSTALTAAVDDTDLRIGGSVPAGETVTVSYTVQVKPYAQQGDHLLNNVVQNPDGTCQDGGCPQTQNPIRHFSVTKSADAAQAGARTGEVVEYTIRVTNDGEGDYTASIPAGMTDDLSDVLDDAVYNDDATATASDGTPVAAPEFSTPVLSWSGPLAAGTTVDIVFSVTVNNNGDAVLRNTATPVCTGDALCDPATPPVTVPLPRITPSKSSLPETGSTVVAGEQITYSLTFSNDGQAGGVVDATDDLSRVLDDADLTGAPRATSPDVSVAFDEDQALLRIEGPLAAGETVTVTYEVTVRADGERGDNLLRNVLTPDELPYTCAEGDDDCSDFTPPSTEHPAGELVDSKASDPASGSTVRAGQLVTYTLHFENIGKAPVEVARDDVLSQVLDDATVVSAPAASDPALSVSAVSNERFTITGTLQPGARAQVSYTVEVNADGARGDDRLGNFLVDAGAEPPVECVAVEGQQPDCTVHHVSDVVVTKTSDPESGSMVREGGHVTYTLSFRNVSKNPDASDVAVDYTDHLSGVLDDASLVDAPSASSTALTPRVEEESIRVVGALASGEHATVSYTVEVSPWNEQSDHQLDNVVAMTGTEPVCVAGNGLCTTHPLRQPDPLATTGAEPAWVAAGTGLALAAVGAWLLLRRRRTVPSDSLQD